MCFGKRVRDDKRRELQGIFGVKMVECHERYLGIPSCSGRRKKDMFNYIKDRVWNKINGWAGKFFSRADKEVLLKSVVRAIPTIL